MAEYYTSMAGLKEHQAEFWDSASMLKQTRANLFANLCQDIEEHRTEYQLKQGITGSFINLLNKIRFNKEHLGPENVSTSDTAQFIREVETTVSDNSILPSVVGNTRCFQQIDALLQQMQRRQIRLIDGLLRYGRDRLVPNELPA